MGAYTSKWVSREWASAQIHARLDRLPNEALEEILGILVQHRESGLDPLISFSVSGDGEMA